MSRHSTINKKIIRLAIPNIISNITVPLLGMVDLAIVGHLNNMLYIDAIAIGTMIFSFIYSIFNFLRMGTSGFTAQAYGERNMAETVNTLARSLAIAVAVAFAIIVLQTPISNISFKIIEGSDEMKLFAYQYFAVRIWAAPATLGIFAFKGWFLGMQNARTPMIISIAQNVLNIMFSLFFVFAVDMGIAGVALGTVIAQYASLFLSIFYFFRYYGKLRKYLVWRKAFDIKLMLNFFNVNGNIFLRTLCLVAVFTFFTVASSKMGAVELAANTLLLQLFTLFSHIMDGFAYAGESIVGKYFGAKNQMQTSLAIRQLFKWGFAMCLLFVAIYAVFGKQILWLLTDKVEVLQCAHGYIFWALIIPLVSFSAFLWDGIFVGATASQLMRNSMFVATAAFFAIYFSLSNIMQNNALWLAFITYLAMRGLMQWAMWRTHKKLLFE